MSNLPWYSLIPLNDVLVFFILVISVEADIWPGAWVLEGLIGIFTLSCCGPRVEIEAVDVLFSKFCLMTSAAICSFSFSLRRACTLATLVLFVHLWGRPLPRTLQDEKANIIMNRKPGDHCPLYKRVYETLMCFNDQTMNSHLRHVRHMLAGCFEDGEDSFWLKRLDFARAVLQM